jgi:hypothetical protein
MSFLQDQLVCMEQAKEGKRKLPQPCSLRQLFDFNLPE